MIQYLSSILAPLPRPKSRPYGVSARGTKVFMKLLTCKNCGLRYIAIKQSSPCRECGVFPQVEELDEKESVV